MRVTAIAIFLFVSAAALRGDIVVPGADGSDGDLIVNTNLTIDLGKAKTGKWDDAGGDHDNDGLGDGVYDPEKWAVVFKWSKVEIKSGVTVTFKNHPSNPPVVWLVKGDCKIDGSVVLDGAEGHSWSGNHVVSIPGPGGYRGGHGNDLAPGSDASSGFGPGGGTTIGRNSNGGGGGFSVAGGNGRYENRDSGNGGNAYGNGRVLPLFGGSGGAGGFYGWNYPSVGGGGAGGGAILIACQTTFTLDGVMSSRGGDGYNDQDNYVGLGGAGSGGAIRLVCDRLSGAGKLRAQPGVPYYRSHPHYPWYGGYASAGRIRVESNDTSGFSHLGDPPYTSGLPGETATLWPDETHPRIRVLSIDGVEVPADPRASLNFPHADVSLRQKDGLTIRMEARNVPTDWLVNVRVVRKIGTDEIIAAALKSGDEALSYWEATATLSDGFSAIQVRAAKPE